MFQNSGSFLIINNIFASIISTLGAALFMPRIKWFLCLYLNLIQIAFSEVPLPVDTCLQFFKDSNLRGVHDFPLFCKNQQIKKSLEEDLPAYRHCVKTLNAITPLTMGNSYFTNCATKKLRQEVIQNDFNQCITNLISTGKSYPLNIAAICLDPVKKNMVITPAFTNCLALMGQFKDNKNLINRCMNKNYIHLLARDDFNKCLKIKNELHDAKDAIETCSQPEYLKIMNSPDFDLCVEKLKQINIYDLLTYRCTNLKLVKQILSSSFIPCIDKLQAAYVSQPMEICTNPLQAEIINSQEYDQCFATLTKLEANDVISKCTQITTLKKINSPAFLLCTQEFGVFEKNNLDTYCLNQKFITIKSKREFITCMEEIKGLGQSDLLNKCSNPLFLKHLNSPAYFQCKSNLATLEITHLIGLFCLEPKNHSLTFSNQDIVCLTTALHIPSNKPILDPDHNNLEAATLLNQLIKSCRSK